MGKPIKEEELCEAIATEEGRMTRWYRCTHRSKHDIEGHKLCGVHRLTYLNGTQITLFGGYETTAFGREVKFGASLQLNLEEEKPRYKIERFSYRGRPSLVKVTPSGYDIKEWRKCNPNDLEVFQEYLAALYDHEEDLRKQLKETLEKAQEMEHKIRGMEKDDGSED